MLETDNLDFDSRDSIARAGSMMRDDFGDLGVGGVASL